MTAPAQVAVDWTENAVLGGRVVVAQDRRGYRYNVDALWLVRHCVGEARGRVVDLGAGSGVIGLCLGARVGVDEVVLVERQAALVRCARRSIELSAPRCPVRILEKDLRQLTAAEVGAPADLVVCNPPFHDVTRSRPAANPQLDQARRALHGDVHDFVRAARRLMGAESWLGVVYPAARRGELLEALRASGLSAGQWRVVQARPKRPPRLILVLVRPGSTGDFDELEPWIEQDSDGSESSLARSLRDASWLDQRSLP
ncbi:MAG: methyltransferase [Pseudomonadota bacterium]